MSLPLPHALTSHGLFRAGDGRGQLVQTKFLTMVLFSSSAILYLSGLADSIC
jgi:hypothetical protein